MNRNQKSKLSGTIRNITFKENVWLFTWVHVQVGQAMGNINCNPKSLVKIKDSTMMTWTYHLSANFRLNMWKKKWCCSATSLTIQVCPQCTIWHVFCDNKTLVSFIDDFKQLHQILMIDFPKEPHLAAELVRTILEMVLKVPLHINKHHILATACLEMVLEMSPRNV